MGKCTKTVTLCCESSSSCKSKKCKKSCPKNTCKNVCKNKAKGPYKEINVIVQPNTTACNVNKSTETSIFDQPFQNSYYIQNQIQMIGIFIFGFLLFILLLIGMFLLTIVFHR